ncbi:putative phytanoyl-CoA dioxygenase [Streptomyces sp. Tu6071]|nr:putative phytanoyl-CoA dioxygenase [Streptomyces sp. Tu6071]
MDEHVEVENGVLADQFLRHAESPCMQRHVHQRFMESGRPHDLSDVFLHAVLASDVGAEIGPLVTALDLAAQKAIVDLAVGVDFCF